MQNTPEQKLGELAWQLITSRPFGTANKRDLELSILQAAADAGLIDETRPAKVSATLRRSLTKTHGYLADLSQRRPPLQDLEALGLLADVLSCVEVLPNDKHLSIPLQRADLRIWLERKLAADGRSSGESSRRDLAKLTSLSLLRLLDSTVKVKKLPAALKRLNRNLNQPACVAVDQRQSTAPTNWADIVNTFGAAVSIATA